MHRGRTRPAGTRGRSRGSPGSSRTCARRQQRLRLQPLLPERCAAPGRRRGIRSARAAFSRKRAPKSAVSPSSATTRSSISAGSITSPRRRRRVRLGEMQRDPSSDQIDCASIPCASRSRAAIAIAHGACTRPPNGVRMHTRQSPISSRNRSTTTVRSDGNNAGVAFPAPRGRWRFVAARALQVEVIAGVVWSAFASLNAISSREGGADLLTQLVRPADPLALPERRPPQGKPGCRRDEHAVARDLLDSPRRRAEQERLTGARLVHHFLVKLADPAAPVDEEHAEETAVGDRAGVRDCEAPGTVARADRAVRCGPRRCAGAAPRIRRMGNARRACRARWGTEPRLKSRNGYAPRDEARRTSSASDFGVSRRLQRPVVRGHPDGFVGMRVSSISPSRIARATTALSSRSARNFGKMRPFETAPSSWPARPMHCRPARYGFGDSTGSEVDRTHSMPSSRLDVATRHGMRPAFSSSSTSTRCSRASEP